MSQENLVKLMQAAAKDEQLAAKLQNASNYEEWKTVAEENGFEIGDLSAEQAQMYMGAMSGQYIGEMTAEELERASGGSIEHGYAYNDWPNFKIPDPSQPRSR